MRIKILLFIFTLLILFSFGLFAPRSYIKPALATTCTVGVMETGDRPLFSTTTGVITEIVLIDPSVNPDPTANLYQMKVTGPSGTFRTDWQLATGFTLTWSLPGSWFSVPGTYTLVGYRFLEENAPCGSYSIPVVGAQCELFYLRSTTIPPKTDITVFIRNTVPTSRYYVGVNFPTPTFLSPPQTGLGGNLNLSFPIEGDQAWPTAGTYQVQGFRSLVPLVEGAESCGTVTIEVISGAFDTLQCSETSCPTALGPISTQPADFVNRLLTIVMGIVGGIAFLMLIVGSLRVATSAGNPDNLATGREMITAAVAGLLFILFAVFLLAFIGRGLLFGIFSFPFFGS